jgi:hypothetical protein
VKVWKKAIPDADFAFSVGPCHNCGTNISRKLWTDPDYVRELLESMVSKGADSISFQSVAELLLPKLPDADIFPDDLRGLARINQGHLAAVVDFVTGRRTSKPAWVRRYARWLGVGEPAARAARKAILASSQIILKQYRQFCYGSSQEGQLYPGRFSHYQEPFFYSPMSFLNRLGELPQLAGMRAWAPRPKPLKVLPEDTQAIIDYVNPAVTERPSNHPGAMIRQIKRHITDTNKAIADYKRAARGKADPHLIEQARRNTDNGERIWREIAIGIELYACYFASSKRKLFNHLRRARELMLDAVDVLGDGLRATDAYCLTTSSGPFIPEQDAEDLAALLAYEEEDVPFAALRSYLRSRERYNEIRRLCRPYAPVEGELAERNAGLLAESLAAAEDAISLLDGPRYALYRDNVMAWAEYVRAEQDWLTDPAMACPRDDCLGPDEGFRWMVHDQCYRWGERCWEDFAGFFRRQNYFRQDRCDCRVTWTKEGLKLSLREHDIDWSEREATWEANRGTVNQTGFMRVFLDPGNAGDRVINYILFFRGEGGLVDSRTRLPDGRMDEQKRRVLEGYRPHFEHTDTSWRFDVVLPWRLIGRRARPGDIWRLNIASNPAVKRNRQVIWRQGYEYRGDVGALGYLQFV